MREISSAHRSSALSHGSDPAALRFVVNQMEPEDDLRGGVRFIRGLIIAFLLSAPSWSVILWLLL